MIDVSMLEQWIDSTGLMPVVLAEELLLGVRCRFSIPTDLERTGLMCRGR